MAAPYNFDDHIKGDTYDGATFTMTVNGSPLDLTGATIRMYLRNKFKVLKKKFSTEPAIGGITITNALAGQFQINKQIIDVPAGVYSHDIEFTMADGTRKTYIVGTWTITQDVTYD